MPDQIFSHPRLAAIYDAFDGERDDLDLYLSIVEEFGATSVLDVGCGTGSFACLLAERGLAVTAVDPAEASLDVARSKPRAADVDWILGDATSLPPLDVDLATMTANVAQVFLDDDDWMATLHGLRQAVRAGGHLAFETRVPAGRAWEQWTVEASRRTIDIPDIGEVEAWVELIDVAPPLVSFRHTRRFAADGAVLTSDSTLRFRTCDEIESSLQKTGWTVLDIRDAPDRPGREFVFLAT